MKLPNDDITLILQHWKETTNWNATPEDITSEPYTKQIKYWWDALTHYKLNHWYSSLDDIESPVENRVYWIWDGRVAWQWLWYGEWKRSGNMTPSMYE